MIRIIAGEYRGHHLLFPKDKRFRPSKDRVKEAMFNILSDSIVEATCLDLFAGSGSLGFEALSRGADFVDFVDVNCDYVKKNAEKLKISDGFATHRKSFERFLKSCTKQYSHIFLDPPWTDLIFFEDSLKQIFQFDILEPSGTIICEHPKDYQIDTYNCIKSRPFGRSKLSFICHD